MARAAAPAYSWERRQPAAGHSWEAPPPGPEAGDNASDASGNPEPAAQAIEEFLELLLGLYYSSSTGAETLCSLGHWADLAGMPGARPDALSPGRPSGHYSRRLQDAPGFGEHQPH